MDLLAAKAIIRQLAACNVTGISFTAGEPLLFFDDLVDLIQLCNKYSLYSRVVTNGFWAQSPQHANQTVSALKVGGLSQLRISFSRWHQAHIRRENIIHAAASCEKTGLDYFISFVTDFSRQDDTLEAFLRDNQLPYFPEAVIYFGRAGKLGRSGVFTDNPPHTCAMNPYLSPAFDMFACCDAAHRFTKTGFLSLGSLRDQSMETLFQKYEDNRLYALIKTVGLTTLASAAGFNASEIVTCRKCELCEKLFNSKTHLDRLSHLAASDGTRWTR